MFISAVMWLDARSRSQGPLRSSDDLGLQMSSGPEGSYTTAHMKFEIPKKK